VKISNSSEPIAETLRKLEPGGSALYKFGKELGRGGIAVVKDAQLKEGGKTYAAKIIH
jgi:hypothetical protein